MDLGFGNLNPNLALAVRGVRLSDPLERERRKLTIAALRDADFTRQLLTEQRMRELDSSDALTRALPELESAGYSPEAVSSALRAYPAGAPAIVSRTDAIRKARAEQEKVAAESADKRMSTRVSAAKLLANQAFQLSNKRDLSPRDVQQWTAMVAENGLERLLPAPQFQDWSNPEAARKTLATAGSSLFEAHQQAESGRQERELSVKIPDIQARTAKTVAETEQMPAELAVKQGALANQRARLGFDMGQAERPTFDASSGQWISRPTKEAPQGRAFTPEGYQNTGKSGERIQSIRKELNTLQPVQDYRVALPVIKSARAAPDTAAGDIDLIYAVGKILDPNSVVRESELKLAIKAGSPAEQVAGYYNYFTGRGRLTPKLRQNLLAMLDNRVGQLKANQESAIAPIKAQVEAQGLPWSQIYTEAGEGAWARPSGPASAPGIKRITPLD